MTTKKCADCGKKPKSVVYVGEQIMCSECARKPPKRITMWCYGSGQLWWNDSAGGVEVEYVRADLVDGKK